MGAQTSTAINACNAIIRLEDHLGALTDISGSSNEITIDFDNDLGDYKSFGSRWRGRLECGSDATFKLKIIYTTGAGEALALWKKWYFTTRGHRRIQVNLPDETPGGDRYEADVFMANANGLGGPADRAEPMMLTLELRPHNGVAHNTIGS